VIRAVFDSNVLVSWFAANTGTLRELFIRWSKSHFDLVISEPILPEVRNAWTIPYWQERMTDAEIAGALVLLRDFANWTEISQVVQGVASHSEDDIILATAVSANSDYLVTGDKQLLAIGYFEGTKIVSPREFLMILEQIEG
jgi:putative PIN family toxin of toxin-antitoxin system